MTSSLETGDQQAAAVQKTPHRVTLESMKAKISAVEYLNPEGLPTMTICVVHMQNGFVVVGKSAPADPENFDLELGKQFAYEDAVRQLWPLEGYLLRETLSAAT